VEAKWLELMAPAISFEDLVCVCQSALVFVDGAQRACYETAGHPNQAMNLSAQYQGFLDRSPTFFNRKWQFFHEQRLSLRDYYQSRISHHFDERKCERP
jgi:hypothetical protein